jgi:hypothetical protein
MLGFRGGCGGQERVRTDVQYRRDRDQAASSNAGRTGLISMKLRTGHADPSRNILLRQSCLATMTADFLTDSGVSLGDRVHDSSISGYRRDGGACGWLFGSIGH